MLIRLCIIFFTGIIATFLGGEITGWKIWNRFFLETGLWEQIYTRDWGALDFLIKPDLFYFLYMIPFFWLGFWIPYIFVSVRHRAGMKKGIFSAGFCYFLGAVLASVMKNYGWDLPLYTVWMVILCGAVPLYITWSHLEYGRLRLSFKQEKALKEEARLRYKKAEFARAKIVFPEKNKKTSWQEYLFIVVLFAAAVLGNQLLGFVGMALALILVSIFGAVYAIRKNGPVRPSDFIDISLPEIWPSDCIYEGYSTGLSEEAMKKKREKKKTQKGPALKFYKDCVEAHVLPGLSHDWEKAQQIARNRGFKKMSNQELLDLYKEGRAMSNANLDLLLDKHKEPEFHREKRIEELKELISAMEYFGLHGKEKRLQILRDREVEAHRKSVEAKQLSKDAPGLFMQRESSSAIAGGIANGFAGLGAGLSVAADVERRNAEVRAQNKANAPLAVSTMLFLSGEADRQAEQERFYMRLQEKAVDAKVEDTNSQRVFRMLKIKQDKVEVSKTGAVTVKATFSGDLDKDGPVIDGTVAARLYRDGVQEASAYFVLPMGGISSRPTTLTTISTRPADPDARYTVKFEPVDLWTIDPI